MIEQQTHHKKVVLIVLIIALIAVVSGITYLIISKMSNNQKASTGPPTAEEWEELKKEHPFIDDVIYTGPFEDMTVYDYPFRKTDSYIKNKEFAADKTQVIDTVNGYVNDVMNANYTDIVNDTASYIEKVEKYMPYGMIFIDAGYYIPGDAVTGDQYIEGLSDYIVENSGYAEAEFITNDSLVYSDGLTYCRGILRTTFHPEGKNAISTDDMVDVELCYSNGEYQIAGIYLAKNFSEELKEDKQKVDAESSIK